MDKTDAYRFASANKDVNKAKNRYVNVLPCESTQCGHVMSCECVH